MNLPQGFVPATLSAAEAEQTPWQVIVVGGGPAGASCAARLAARGVCTLLLDRQPMPRAKVCGCCLSSTAVAELADLAAVSANAALGRLPVAPLDRVLLQHRGRAASLPLTGGGVISREALDPALVRAAIATGVQWLPECQVMAVADAPAGGAADCVSITVGSPRAAVRCTLATNYVVWATGLGGKVPFAEGGSRSAAAGIVARRSRIGIGMVLPAAALDIPAGQLIMAIADEGYGGLVRLEDGRLDLAAAVDPRVVSHGASPAAAVAALLSRAAGAAFVTSAFDDAVRRADVRATPPLTRRAALVAGASGRILRVGDAAGYVEPFTGEGIGWALAGGRMLATALAPRRRAAGESMPAPATVAESYGAAYRRFFGGTHPRCQRVAGFVRRPVAVTAAVAVARIAPWLARRAVPAVVGTRSERP